MKTLGLQAYQEVRSWIYLNARQIELTLWQYFFENGNKEAVLSALSFYQNEDGGFGNALEADSWNPNSSPYTTLYAINILKYIDFNDTNHSIMQGIFKFLESGKYFCEKGWLFNIPSNNDYAHAPWWTYNSEANEVESIGVTAGLGSFIMRFYDSNSDLYKKAMLVSKHIIEKLKAQSNYGDMGVGGYIVLLETIQQLGIQGNFDYEFLLHTTKKLVNNSIERDTSKWAYYCVRPSNYITDPGSIFYGDNEGIVQTELDYLIDTRGKNGVWDITWSWFENNEKYAKEFAISENWWKAYKAIENIIFLKKFGRLY